MTMDVATCLDPRDRRRPRGVADGFDRLRHLHVRLAARDAPGDGRHAGRGAAGDDDGVVRGGGARRHRPRPERARVLAADEGDGAAVRAVDPRRRLHVRLRAHRRRPPQPLGRGVRLRRGVDRVPARAGRPVPGAARRLLRGPALDRAARRRAGHRPDPHRDRRGERRRWARRRSRHPRPRSRRGRRRVPAPHLSDDRRPQHQRVEPHRRRAGVEPRREPPGVARVPGRPGRHRRRPGRRGAGPGGERRGAAPGVDRRRFTRRLPRRGHPVRVAPVGGRDPVPSCTSTPERATASR